jgi:HAD superfamily hydrolase (TIGR01450 family)
MINKLYLVDIEGTIVKDKSYVPIEGAVEWINSFRSSTHSLVLVSNNTTHKPGELVLLLKQTGFDIGPENLITCLSVALNWLKENKVKRCFVIGTPHLKEYLNENKIDTPSDDRVEAVLVGLDITLDYAKLKIALNALVNNHATLLALHSNRLYKDDKGELSPSVGAAVKALEYSSQKEAIVLGKPSPEIYLQALGRFKAEPEDGIMISDDPFSDLAGAKMLGMKTIFVTSGKYKDREVLISLDERYQPDWIHSSVKEIII